MCHAFTLWIRSLKKAFMEYFSIKLRSQLHDNPVYSDASESILLLGTA